MIVRFRLGNITETRPVHGKLDHHVSAGRKRDGFKQLHVCRVYKIQKHFISSCCGALLHAYGAHFPPALYHFMN